MGKLTFYLLPTYVRQMALVGVTRRQRIVIGSDVGTMHRLWRTTVQLSTIKNPNPDRQSMLARWTNVLFWCLVMYKLAGFIV